MTASITPAFDPLTVRFVEDAALPMLGTMMSLFESSDDCVKIIGADGRLASMNCNGRVAMEIDDFRDVMGLEWATLWPEDSRQQIRDSLAQALSGQVSRIEAFCPTAKGTPKWWEVTVAPIADDQGAIHWALSSSRDITERVTREQQLETMALEMRHRLRNAYGSSAGLIKAMARSHPESREFAEAAAQQLSHLASIQSSLLDFNERISLVHLIERVCAGTYDRGAIKVNCATQATLTEPIAKALAVVIGEFLANSGKYGALATEGQVQIVCTELPGRIQIDWSETNGHVSASAAISSSGQGKLLKQRMMASIGGTIATEVGDGCFTAQLQFPLPAG